jgi:hypothetical protein
MTSGTGDVPAIQSRGAQVAGAAILSIALVALVARWLGSRGELWIDEIWSLTLIAPLSGPFDVFWKIAHDNNHFLNSFWLMLAGPDADVTLYRFPSVVFGGLSVIAAASIFWRSSKASAAVAAILIAVALAYVQHGSEARGYSGLIFFVLVALSAWVRTAGDHENAASRWVLALAVGLGAFFHLTMVAALAVMGLASLIVLFRQKLPIGDIFGRCLTIYVPAGVALLPVFVAIIAGVRTTGEFAVGGVDPFTFKAFIFGYGGALANVAVPEGFVPGAIALAVAAALIGAGWAMGLISAPLRALAIAGLIVLPLIMLALRPPNMGYPRYFLIPGLIFLIVFAEMLGELWRRDGAMRVCAGVSLALIVLGQGAAVAAFLRDGRGAREPVVRAILASDDRSYGSNAAFGVPMTVNYYAKKLGGQAEFVPEAEFCERQPHWFIGEVPRERGAPPQKFTYGPEKCPLAFELDPVANKPGYTELFLYRRL